MKRETKIIRAWGGFYNGHLHRHEVDRGWGGWGYELERSYAIYSSAKRAQQHYEDVRPIEIHIIPKGRRMEGRIK